MNLNAQLNKDHGWRGAGIRRLLSFLTQTSSPELDLNQTQNDQKLDCNHSKKDLRCIAEEGFGYENKG